MLSQPLWLVPFFLSSVFAANNWSIPCFTGVCEYDLDNNGTASGTLKLWGSDAAITDITPAAGWQILNCSSDALSQDIRLVCTDSASGCAHLYSNSSRGAIGKVVRLPENCGANPFAVVTKMYRSPDQTIPSGILRRTGSNTTVQGMSISTDFGSVGLSSGPVNFAIRAANVPGAGGDLTAAGPQQQRRRNIRVFRRGLSDFISGAVNEISSLNDFNVDNSTTLPPLDVDKSFNLLDQSISCPPVSGGVKVDVDAKAHAVASIGLAASGTIVPPEISSFAIITGLNADIDGTVFITADASGSLDSGKITLFEVGVPGLDFPGILTIGPSFKIEGQATASLDANVNVTVGLTYSISNAQLVFPPPSVGGASNGSFNIGDTPLKISASPSASASGSVSAHLIPSLNLGISALGDIVDASVFLELDASAEMTLTAQAAGNVDTSINKRTLPPSSFLSKRFSTYSKRSSPAYHLPEVEYEDDPTNEMDTGYSDDGGNGDVYNSGPNEYMDSVDTDENSDTTDDSTLNSDDKDSQAMSDNNSTDPYGSTIYNNTESNTGSDHKGMYNSGTASNSSGSDSDYSGSGSASTDNSTYTNSSSSTSNTSFSGCFEIDGNLDVNAGATGDFFGLFNKNTQVQLFSKKFEIFKKCFGNNADSGSYNNKRRRASVLRSSFYSVRMGSDLLKGLTRRDNSLQCPLSDIEEAGALVDLVDEIVSASSIE